MGDRYPSVAASGRGKIPRVGDFNRERLRAIIQERGETPREISLRMGQNAYLVRDILNGRSANPRLDTVHKLAEALHVPVGELTGDSTLSTRRAGNVNGDDRNRRTVPVVGYVGAGAQAHYYATGDGELDRVEAPEYANENTVGAKIQGPSVGPLFDGWLVFWDDVRSPVTEDLYNELCVVGLPDDRILVKQIKPAGAPGRFHLLSNNEAPMFDEEVIWAAMVKGMQPR